jgi:hypothetical protein
MSTLGGALLGQQKYADAEPLLLKGYDGMKARENTIRLFDVARRQQVAELRGHADYVHAVAWSPDGARLVSGSGDFTVRVWDSLSAQDRAKRAADKPPPH